MNDTGQAPPKDAPLWVWGVIVALACIPLVNLTLVQTFPPAGLVTSGLHTVDTYCYVTPMRYMSEAFQSPYARVTDHAMPAGVQYYGMPYHFLYGALGWLNVLNLPALWVLAVANGLGLALLLGAVWRLLTALLPDLRETTFLLLVVGGGLGGLLGFLGCGLGWWESAAFQQAFPRWFRYDVVEGARGNVHLLQDRLYYTLPLGLAILGWTRLQRGCTLRNGIYLALATFINFRIGPMVWAVALLPMLAGETPRNVRGVLVWTGGMVAGLACALWVAGRNPSHFESSLQISREAIAFSAYLGATALLLPPAAWTIWRTWRQCAGWRRVAVGGGVGYMATFTLLHAGYHVYYGSGLLPLDFAATLRVSDWALVGIPLGVVASLILPHGKEDDGLRVWLALWALGAIGVGVSAWGDGWFVRLAPQRLIVMTGIPVAALAAYALQRWAAGLRRAYLCAVVVCGGLSIAFTWLVSHGPFLDGPASALLPWTRYAYIEAADAEALGKLESGVVLAPSKGAPLYGDVVAARTGCSVVYGNGTLDFSRENLTELRRRVAGFYAATTTTEERLALLNDWQVRYVLCPARAPVAEDVRHRLRKLPGMRVVYETGTVLLLERDVTPPERSSARSGR